MESWYLLGIGIAGCVCIAVLWAVDNHKRLPRAPSRNERCRLADAMRLSSDDVWLSQAARARAKRATPCNASSEDDDEVWQHFARAQYPRQFARHKTRMQDCGGSHGELCCHPSPQTSQTSSLQRQHSDPMLTRLELEEQLAQLAQEMKRRDDQLARAKRRLVAKEAEIEQLKKQLALAAQGSLRVVPSTRHASDPPRGDQTPATPTRSKSRQPVAGGTGRTENEEKPVRRTLTSGTRFLAANLSESCLPRTPPQLPRTPSKPSTVPTNEQPKVATDKSKADRGPESAASSGVGSEASRVVRDAGAAAGGRRLPNEGASLEARWSSVAISHGTTRGSPPEMPDVPPTPLVRFLQSLLCRVS